MVEAQWPLPPTITSSVLPLDTVTLLRLVPPPKALRLAASRTPLEPLEIWMATGEVLLFRKDLRARAVQNKFRAAGSAHRPAIGFRSRIIDREHGPRRQPAAADQPADGLVGAVQIQGAGGHVDVHQVRRGQGVPSVKVMLPRPPAPTLGKCRCK